MYVSVLLPENWPQHFLKPLTFSVLVISSSLSPTTLAWVSIFLHWLVLHFANILWGILSDFNISVIWPSKLLFFHFNDFCYYSMGFISGQHFTFHIVCSKIPFGIALLSSLHYKTVHYFFLQLLPLLVCDIDAISFIQQLSQSHTISIVNILLWIY